MALDKQALLAELASRVDALPEHALLPLEREMDLYSLFESLNSLKVETKQTNRHSKEALQLLKTALDTQLQQAQQLESTWQAKLAEQARSLREQFMMQLIDNFDRVYASCQFLEKTLAKKTIFSRKNHAERGFLVGQQRLLQSLSTQLAAYDVSVIAEVGESFDPQRMQAVLTQTNRRQPDQVVLAVSRVGFCTAAKVIRPAQVVINVLEKQNV